MSTPVAENPSLPECVRELEKRLGGFAEEQRQAVRRAYHVGAEAHAGQQRQSGEDYITHPVAVATILADLGMDAETIVAAILHDTLEDTGLTHEALSAQFGVTVAELVQGVTKLDKVRFGSRQEATAESFRKMLLAVARDLRVILIKLADRLHNMRTLGAMQLESRRRIARETLEIYAPIAQRLGMNLIKAELQDLGFRNLYPDRYRIIAGRIRDMLGNRREVIERIEAEITMRLADEGIKARVIGRIKSPYSIYKKMRSENKTFDQVTDVYGFRVVTSDVPHAYMALGSVHGLYKPVDKRFKDFIAIPKANGYQSLHTVLFGPFGAPIEVQIRTESMDTVAERGVAAHWAYKTDENAGNAAQARAREWVEGLVDSQARKSGSLEFLENVKIDLFPDEVYLFTPKGDILSLPRNATALDFAYAVHTDVGNHTVMARVDGKLVPLRTRLESGQRVEITTSEKANPKPQWLEFVVTGKARTGIRHYLKHLQHEDAVEFGHRMLDRALHALSISLDSIDPDVLQQFLKDQRLRRLEDLLADVALGNRMADHVAGQLHEISSESRRKRKRRRKREKITISGSERGVLSFANCCHPVPGDAIFGYMSSGKGVVVHRVECPNAAELSKHAERYIGMDWDRDVEGVYKVELRLEVANETGVLAEVAAAIAQVRSNIENIEYAGREVLTATLLITIEVDNRKHLADVMRKVRRLKVVRAVYRHPV